MVPKRLQALQALLPQHKLDALVVTHLPNIRYLTGFTGSSAAVVVPRDGRTMFITDGRYTEQARQQVKTARIVIAKKSGLLAAGEWLLARRHGRRRSTTVGIEPANMSVADRDRLAGLLGEKGQVCSAPDMIQQLRMVKDEHEIALIREAVLAGDALFERLVKAIRPGVKETAVAAELEYAARMTGCDAMSFETIIAAGARSALPHGRASDQLIPERGFVVCDFGVILAGYCSDMTRTLYVGHAEKEAKLLYQAVREAQLAGIDAVRPGVPVGEVDKAARSVLRKAGLGRYFTHSTGHGVGLEIHEPPRIAAGQSELLQPGMVITIEPGAYIARKWGVRIEDMVLVTNSGCESLTATGKDLICI